MFWSIISRSTRLGLKAGAAAGALYSPVTLLVAFVCSTLWRLTHPSLQNNITLDDVKNIGHDGPPVALFLVILLMALSGGFFGTILGFLNGVLVAVAITAFNPLLTQKQIFRCAVVSACVLLSLVGTACLLHLLFATDLFTNFSDPGTPSKPSGPTRMIGLLTDPGTIALFIAGPSLVAAAIAYWASNQVLSWYAASALTPLESKETPEEPVALDHLWPL